MKLDPDACYRAVTARDGRFDGLFFVAVRTTGIYCRPVCRARTPGRDRCVFYRTA
ncbi:MAG TPA: Ada metal-binding domain-containing protein, partial [Myxococcaceae bacterium]|nr:Ada metal-binding domain-containing protein [Myxococcaceae bacterium]